MQSPVYPDTTMRLKENQGFYKKRLILCLDGTWNNRDDCTNVLHHYSIAPEVLVDSKAGISIEQRTYYHPGVGTRALDRITGGAFGFGLEQNVRDAYNWLVQNYDEQADGSEADEIFIFGFSRGAYTARSLAGFIGRCGLLRRAAPLTVRQLWQNYCVLGRQHEHRHSFWERLFGEDPVSARQITELLVDPWQVARFEAQRNSDLGQAATDQSSADRVPGQRVDNLNETEKLLVRWSRRVRITYLGIYDTVGAMGWDALAIPGLKSRIALHHNMRPTTLIQNCRHALAIDEHRSNFSHLPLVEYLGHAGKGETSQSDGPAAGDPRPYWSRIDQMWRRKIEQRWFVGAHSNVGGGYPDNELARRPFEWVLEGARDRGLVCRPLSNVPVCSQERPRDSYSEFAMPFWTMILRAKRNYRPLHPPTSLRAAAPSPGENANARSGFSLKSINEQVDDSVFSFWSKINTYRPPNLIAFARHRRTANAQADHQQDRDKRQQDLDKMAKEQPPHPWCGEKVLPYIAAVLWATLAAAGLITANDCFALGLPTPLPFWLLGSVAAGFAFVDWAESRVGFSLALKPGRPRSRAFQDSIYWARALGVVLFFFGLLAFPVYAWTAARQAETFGDILTEAWEPVWRWGSIAFCAGMAVVAALLVDGASPRGFKAESAAALGGPLVAGAAVVLAVLLAWLAERILLPLLAQGHPVALPPPHEGTTAGLLLLLQLGILCFLKASTWVGQPMTDAHLGSMFPLQFACSPRRVMDCLDRWVRKLECPWSEADKTNGTAPRALHDILREALGRDNFGFIPLYSVLLGFGLWFNASQLGWEWLNQITAGMHLWLLLPLTAALADYVENACHLRYVALHERTHSPPPWLVSLSFTATLIKFAAFLIAAGLTIAGLAVGTAHVINLGAAAGWRGTVTLSITAAAFILVSLTLLSAAFYRHKTARTRQPRSQSSPGSSASPSVEDAGAIAGKP
jgi:uncharacterized protein (DUF2235 family)